jgi:tRNA pseudouridine55 synthase
MLHGILIVDKPAHMSSAYVVELVRRRAKVAKAGHTGTLDPIATGVLPICLGGATKLAGYLIAEDKGYEAELELGVETDTLDRTGTVTGEHREAAEAISDEALLAALAARRGPQEQLPPMFSAIKQDGVRLYHRARAGEEVERPLRPIVIHRLELKWRRGRRAAISVHCSKGTFIRSLISDLGKDLGVGAHLAELRRTRSGSYTLAQAVPLDSLTPASAAAHLIPLPRMLSVPSVVLPPERYAEVRDGRPEVLREYAASFTGMGQLVSESGQLLALLETRPEGPRYLRVFPEGMQALPAPEEPA